MVKRFLFLFFSIFLFGIFFPTQSHAAENFTTDYNVTYTIDEKGTAHALVGITLTNTSSQFYAPSYKMQLGFSEITNVSARDGKGQITPIISKNADGYVVEVQFNNKAVGLHNKQQFDIMFDTSNIARNHGKIWEIDIPGIANPDNFASFVVNLKVPPSFGVATYIKPKQSSNSLTFTKETLGKSGISIAFGQAQMYDFYLTYHVRNPNLYPIMTEIALPPTTNYQDISLSSITPKPINVIEDKDGNWLAQYKLTSAQKLDVEVKGNAKVQLIPKQVELSPRQQNAYTKEAKYWETSDQKIQNLAQKLKTPQAIYQYVARTLKYDFSRVTEEKPRLGALGSLKNPNSAVCREYTDLFIAIARAAGFPAREVNGFAYTENAKQRPLSLEKDILHVWPEYYDKEKKAWIMVDPTWGSTTGGVDYFDTMDFAHLAFVVKGTSSEYPIPAGGYKFPDVEPTKDVQVEFTTEEQVNEPDFAIDSTVPEVGVAGLPMKGVIRLINTGSTYISPQIVYLTSNTFKPGNQTLATNGIPPFGQTEVPVKFAATSFLTNTEGDYTIRVAGETNVQHVKAALFFTTPIGGGIIIGLLAFIILAIAIKSRRLRLFR